MVEREGWEVSALVVDLECVGLVLREVGGIALEGCWTGIVDGVEGG